MDLSPRPTAIDFSLDRRAWRGSEEDIDATVAGEQFQRSLVALAVTEPLAGASHHGLCLETPSFRAYERERIVPAAERDDSTQCDDIRVIGKR